jgi:hypothetical protein
MASNAEGNKSRVSKYLGGGIFDFRVLSQNSLGETRKNQGNIGTDTRKLGRDLKHIHPF